MTTVPVQVREVVEIMAKSESIEVYGTAVIPCPKPNVVDVQRHDNSITVHKKMAKSESM